MQEVLPTPLDLSGVPAPADAAFDGVSLTPLLRGSQQGMQERMLVVQYGAVSERDRDAAVTWNEWPVVNGTELHDLSNDPRQKDDLAGHFTGTVARTRRHFDEWWNEREPIRAHASDATPSAGEPCKLLTT